MKKALKIISRALILLVVLFGLLNLYFAVGATVFGPKTAVNNMCSELVGMTVTDAKALHPTGSSINFAGVGTIEIFTEQKGEWICVCQVAADDNDIIESYDVPCLD